MSSSAKPTGVRFDADNMWVELTDGRTVGVPLAWFPRLLRATAKQREQVRLSSRGLHWEALDEDISVAGLLAGLGDLTKASKTHAA
jgi:selenophosphate synthetase-related protein